MERPQSIIWFERFYLGSLALGIVDTVANWSKSQAEVVASPGAALLPTWFMPLAVSISIFIGFLLWYFVARRASVVAKWINVIFFGLALIALPQTFSRVSTGADSPLQALASLIVYALNGAAVWMLFRPDTKPWFDKKTPDLRETFN